MLPAPHRLRGDRAIARVRRASVAARSDLFTLRVAWRGERGGAARVAIAVGLHVSRRAVDRNRVVRWARAGFQPLLGSLPLGVDLYLSARAPASRFTAAACAEDIHSLLAHAGLLRRSTP